MASAFVFVAASDANVAQRSDSISSHDRHWLQDELRRPLRLTPEASFPSPNREEEIRRALIGIYHAARPGVEELEEEQQKKGGLLCTHDDWLTFGACKTALSHSYQKSKKEEEGGGGGAEEEAEEVSLTGGNVSIVGFLKACSDKKDLDGGRYVHSDIVKRGAIKKNVFLGSSIVNLYAKCGALEEAQAVFDQLPVRNIVTWNALIWGYAQYEHGEDALECYDRMESQRLSPTIITFLCILKACGAAGAPHKGRRVHSQIIKAGLLQDDRVGTALVDMYAKCGLLVKAQEMFDSLTHRDLVSWTALVLGYAQHEYGEEALKCFEQMQSEGLRPDAHASVCILKACGSIGLAYEGQRIHTELVSSELLEQDIVAGSALVDMYANCGMLAEAQQVFDKLHSKNVVAWSALMEGYAQLGKDETVFSIFDEMIREATEPSRVTFNILLNACCHRGLLDKAKMYFELLNEGYGITPAIEHYTCVIDLFCRAGHLDKAIAVVKEMPVCANSALWHTLLDACQKMGNMKLGRWAFERVLELDDKDAGAYVCLSNFPTRMPRGRTKTGKLQGYKQIG